MHIKYLKYFTLILLLLTIDALYSAEEIHAETNGIKKATSLHAKSPAVLPSLVISHREIDLGTISTGREKEGSFSVKNIGSDSLAWTIPTPEEWFPLDKTELLGISVRNEEMVHFRVSAIKKEDDSPGANGGEAHLPVQLILDNRSNRLTCVRELAVGDHRIAIKIQTPGGMQRTVFIKFNLLAEMEDVSISVNPSRLDFGAIKPGDSVTRRMRLTNKSQGMVKWKAKRDVTTGTAPGIYPHRYISFLNDDAAGKGIYDIPPRLEKTLQLWGTWKEYQGYPALSGKCILKMEFWGSAVSLFVNKRNSTGQFSIYIDNTLIKSYELRDSVEDNASYEIPVSEGFFEANHILTLVLNGSGAAIEGVQIKRQDVLEGNRNWLTIFPESGFTLKETDYINVTLNPVQSTNPGVYSNLVHITSNNGNIDVPVSYEIVQDIPVKNIDIYRYYKAPYYLYISDLPSEELRLTSKGFIKQGLAFSLFQPGTLGTVPFHRWYNPKIINQFYSYDIRKGNSLLGYIYEGAVGNIATTRLKGTRELYRWFNPKTRQHFFTLDPKGEGMSRKGYIFDGIAGYIK